MTSRDAQEVARRTICLELLLQRFGLETSDEVPLTEREKLRQLWVSRLGELQVEGELLPPERAFLERPVGSLSEDDLDDIHGRAIGALVLLWALGRLQAKPGAANIEQLADLLGTHGLLGDGSISKAREAIRGATLREATALDEACAAYERTRGKAKEATDPEKIIAELAAHHLACILDRSLPFE